MNTQTNAMVHVPCTTGTVVAAPYTAGAQDADKQLDMFAGADGLNPLQQKALRQALRIMDALPIQYVVLTADGQAHTKGDIVYQLKKAKRTKGQPRTSKYPYGSVTKHVKMYIDPMEPGDCVDVPVAPFDVETVMKGCSSYGVRQWGPGMVMVARTADGAAIQVLRIG